jgi:hypothetical protein
MHALKSFLKLRLYNEANQMILWIRECHLSEDIYEDPLKYLRKDFREFLYNYEQAKRPKTQTVFMFYFLEIAKYNLCTG